jgi:hypothetical protein
MLRTQRGDRRHMSTALRPCDKLPIPVVETIREVCRCRKIHRDFKTKRPHSKPGTPHTAVTISQTGFKPTRLIFWKKQHSVVILWYVTHSIQIHETLIWNPI